MHRTLSEKLQAILQDGMAVIGRHRESIAARWNEKLGELKKKQHIAAHSLEAAIESACPPRTNQAASGSQSADCLGQAKNRSTLWIGKASARPRPREAPVTTATFPFSSSAHDDIGDPSV
ncbi:hypothetical protein P9213_04170 [Geobacillus stearothermophilus]|uniref:hypothetical protein n=1 Tax=Geobacillus stearothermophilus TaxID=1422 RepID=UPI00191C48C7|nr:hypothetical protein [Geobacillus stearothermophilus]MED3842352.1 hypothetical protein [Geobacillus stearothermophilus]MED4355907.1 hypothetical protein [Geobacillus stearothermophilus]